MNIAGIPFTNRIKTDNSEGQRDVNLAQFTAFASLCAQLGVSNYVRSVEWSGNCDSFEIEVDSAHEFNDIGGAIGYAADATLGQYILFGTCWHKGSLEGGQ